MSPEEALDQIVDLAAYGTFLAVPVVFDCSRDHGDGTTPGLDEIVNFLRGHLTGCMELDVAEFDRFRLALDREVAKLVAIHVGHTPPPDPAVGDL